MHNRILALVLLTALAFAFRVLANPGDTYDFVIVGAGIAGLVLANRLSEDRHSMRIPTCLSVKLGTKFSWAASVLVIERGDFDDKFSATVPGLVDAVDSSIIMRVPSAPNEKLSNSTFSVAAAAVVGGGSVVNGMGYYRGSETDYNAWEALGNPGWGWDGLYPYFLRGTRFAPPTPEAIREFNITWEPRAYGNGPLPLHSPSFIWQDVKTFRQALQSELGVVVRQGSNFKGNNTGLFWIPSTLDARDMTRATARSAYYDPVNASRPNLHLVRRQTAVEILFDEGKQLRAKGIRMVSRADNTTSRSVFAKKEVILSAGALMTTHLLQLSGIGPAAVLKAAGVQVKKDMPAVGANYQDHPVITMSYNLTNQSFPNPDTIAKNATYNATVWLEYLVNKTGPLTVANPATLVAFSLSDIISPKGASAVAARLLAQPAGSYLPREYQASPALLRGFEAQRVILAQHLNSSTTPAAMHPFPGNGFIPAPLFKVISRGIVALNASNPTGLPIVNFHTYLNPLDSENHLAIFRRLRRFWKNPLLVARFNPQEIIPGPKFQTDEEILREFGQNPAVFRPSLAHPSGTCAMMPEKLGGCVDPELRVYGISGLRVVDASVIPMIPSASLQATVYALAEKAADLIRGVIVEGVRKRS